MTVKDLIKNNPYRGMGVVTNDSLGTLSSHYSKMKAFSVIGKHISFPIDMDGVFGCEVERSAKTLATYMSELNSPESRLRHGLFWFIQQTETDAEALNTLNQTGNLTEARKTWEKSPQNMSSLQNQLVCCLLKDPRSYSKAIQIASRLYEEYGEELVNTLSNGINVVAKDQLMCVFLEEIVKIANNDYTTWDKAVKRSGLKEMDHLWTESKASVIISQLQQALNAAQSTDIDTMSVHFDIANNLMTTAKPLLKQLKALTASHPILLSRYMTIADNVCKEILNRDISYYNSGGWLFDHDGNLLALECFCYRNAVSIRFKERCQHNINITLGRDEDAPLFPNGKPDNLNEKERAKANTAIGNLLCSLQTHQRKKTGAIVSSLLASSDVSSIVSSLSTHQRKKTGAIVSSLQASSNIFSILSSLKASQQNKKDDD